MARFLGLILKRKLEPKASYLFRFFFTSSPPFVLLCIQSDCLYFQSLVSLSFLLVRLVIRPTVIVPWFVCPSFHSFYSAPISTYHVLFDLIRKYSELIPKNVSFSIQSFWAPIESSDPAEFFMHLCLLRKVLVSFTISYSLRIHPEAEFLRNYHTLARRS